MMRNESNSFRRAFERRARNVILVLVCAILVEIASLIGHSVS